MKRRLMGNGVIVLDVRLCSRIDDQSLETLVGVDGLDEILIHSFVVKSIANDDYYMCPPQRGLKLLTQSFVRLSFDRRPKQTARITEPLPCLFTHPHFVFVTWINHFELTRWLPVFGFTASFELTH